VTPARPSTLPANIRSFARRGTTIAALLLLGCARGPRMHPGETTSVRGADALGRAAGTLGASMFECEEDDVDVRMLGASSYEVSGCGRRGVYACTTRPAAFHREPVCVLQGALETVAREAARASWDDAAIHRAVGSVNDELVTCIDPAHLPLRVTLTFSARGAVSASSWPSEVGLVEQRCAADIVGAIVMSGSVPSSRRVVLTLHPRAASTRADTPSSDAGYAESLSRYEAELRTRLDGDASAIIACNEGHPTAVTIAWTENGLVSPTLRGALQGSDVEGCVIALLAHLPSPPAGASGTLLHVVRAPSQ
jgi:hypothetical protein